MLYADQTVGRPAQLMDTKLTETFAASIDAVQRYLRLEAILTRCQREPAAVHLEDDHTDRPG